MHPFEHLRYVARAGDLSQDVLVREAAAALGALASDPQALVTACRRILSKYPIAGALWSMAAHVCASSHPHRAARDFVSELQADTTADHLTAALPESASICLMGWPDFSTERLEERIDVLIHIIDAYGEGAGLCRQLDEQGCDVNEVPLTGLAAVCSNVDLVVVEAAAASPQAAIAASGSYAAAAVGYVAGRQVWCVVGYGRALPPQLFDAAADTIADEPWQHDEETVPFGLFSHVVGPDGITPAVGWNRTDCPLAGELLRPAI